MEQTWQVCLQAAIDETDVAKLPRKVTAAETAMFQRGLELESQPAANEREALRQGADALGRLQTERLRWPKSGYEGTF